MKVASLLNKRKDKALKLKKLQSKITLEYIQVQINKIRNLVKDRQ